MNTKKSIILTTLFLFLLGFVALQTAIKEKKELQIYITILAFIALGVSAWIRISRIPKKHES